MVRDKTTHIRVEKDILKRAKIELPESKPQEIFKIGFQFLKGLDNSGKFVYGKNVWNKFKKK